MKGLGERKGSGEERSGGKKGLHMHRKNRVSLDAGTEAYPTDPAAYKLVQLCGRGASSQAGRCGKLCSGGQHAWKQRAECHICACRFGRRSCVAGQSPSRWYRSLLACTASSTCAPLIGVAAGGHGAGQLHAHGMRQLPSPWHQVLSLPHFRDLRRTRPYRRS